MLRLAGRTSRAFSFANISAMCCVEDVTALRPGVPAAAVGVCRAADADADVVGVVTIPTRGWRVAECGSGARVTMDGGGFLRPQMSHSRDAGALGYWQDEQTQPVPALVDATVALPLGDPATAAMTSPSHTHI